MAAIQGQFKVPSSSCCLKLQPQDECWAESDTREHNSRVPGVIV